MKRAKAPTTAEQDWQDFQRSQGCAFCGGPAEIHHCIGSAGRHNKIHLGQWFTVPLCGPHHKNLHGDRSAFGGKRRKDVEKHFFQWSLIQAVRAGVPQPPQEVISAIEDYSI